MDDVDFLNNSCDWPHVVCPVKSRTRKNRGLPLCGFILPNEPIVYIKNLFDLQSGLLAPQLVDAETYKYNSFDEMVIDGWMVD